MRGIICVTTQYDGICIIICYNYRYCKLNSLLLTMGDFDSCNLQFLAIHIHNHTDCSLDNLTGIISSLQSTKFIDTGTGWGAFSNCNLLANSQNDNNSHTRMNT